MSVVIGLRKTFGDFTISVDHLEIPEKGICILSGPSGAGKSSFLRILIGLENADQGQWLKDQQNLLKLKISDRKLGVVFQTPDVFGHLNLQQNLYFAAQARKLSEKIYLPQTEELLRRVELWNLRNKKSELLSGGEKQRLCLVRAIIGQPQLLILDEPFNQLDEKSQHLCELALAEEASVKDTPILLVTHQSLQMLENIHKLVLFEQGNIKFQSTQVAEIRHHLLNT